MSGNEISIPIIGYCSICRVVTVYLAQDPGRVFKNKKMPGRMGGKNKTTQNLRVIRVCVVLVALACTVGLCTD